jgi:FAD/FMN-containing dehydrogenase
MATAGDRKLFKAAAFASLAPARFAALFAAFSDLMAQHPDAKGSALILELHPHTAVCSTANDATAFGNRGAWFNLNASLRWAAPAHDGAMRAWAAAQVDALRAAEPAGAACAGPAAYANYGLGDERARDVFGGNYARLQRLKARFDPDGVFRKWFPIVPDAGA